MNMRICIMNDRSYDLCSVDIPLPCFMWSDVLGAMIFFYHTL